MRRVFIAVRSASHSTLLPPSDPAPEQHGFRTVIGRVLLWIAAQILLGLLFAGCEMPPVESPSTKSVSTPAIPAGEPPVSTPPTPAGEPPAATAPTPAPTPTPTPAPTPAVTVEPRELSVAEGGAASYRVALGSLPTGTVTVTITSSSTELTPNPVRLLFTPDRWAEAQAVTVTAATDEDALADDPVALSHTASGGGYGDVTAPVARVTIIESDVATIAALGGRAVEGARRLGFAVTLSLASDQLVTVDYASGAAGDSAVAGQDYTPAAGTLTFPAGAAATETVDVAILDDEIDEPDEQFVLTLSNASVALAGGGATFTATGTIEDDDEPPGLSITHAALTEGSGGGVMRFTVNLHPASGHTVTVDYATADGTATAGADYTSVSGTLTFAPGTTAHTIAVPTVDDEAVEEAETFSVTLTAPQHATLSVATGTGTIGNDDVQPLVLSGLQVTGGGTMYPAFAADTFHYALTCTDSTTLQVAAQALDSATQLTLLRANPDDNQSSAGSLNVQVGVDEDHDVVIELSDTPRTATYVVHCLPSIFPELRILKKTDGATDGLLFITPQYQPLQRRFKAVVDQNGVPRFHETKGTNLRPQPHGPVIAGRRVRYSISQDNHPQLLDDNFERIHTVEPAGDITTVNPHDFLITREGRFLLMSYHVTNRDLSGFTDSGGDPLPSSASVEDGVIQEVTQAGAQQFLWNSWDYLKVDPDCNIVGKSRRDPVEYAHLNSLQVVDGDIIASFRGCSQVLRIDRSSGTGAVEWQLGGTTPARDAGTEYLELVGDPSGEFCKQHQATLTSSDTVVLFDNGTGCLGPRKDQAIFSRVVEYDISSGTQAVFVREYRRPSGHGYSRSKGGVTVLDNGNWLITWGNTDDATVPQDDIIAISEVNPATGTSVFEMHMSSSDGLWQSYRVYLLPETEVSITPNLP